ncbi:MAG TPA: glycosyltransferase family 4 protein [Gemmatimonadaceae bacterium]|nr:glycosyltransferase family 4 protein [Gemmatimonadaceae bacterium]
MRIAMISTPFLAVPPRGYGGTELIVSTLVEGLHARGHDVTLFATGDSRTGAELRALYPVAQWPPDPLADVNHVSWALGEVARGAYDVVHAHSAVALGMARLLPTLPLVYTLHHERDERLSAFYRYVPDAFYVAISHDQARREVALPRLEVIHHGLDPAAYGWTDRPRDYVCFVGRLAEVKGPHTAIDAARLAGVPIRVAGEVHPPDRPFAERAVLPRLAEPHVTYLGAVGPITKRPLLRDARALLAPIAWNEPFGLILVEAMLSGCPVVAFARGSVPELVEEGVTGFVVETMAEMTDVIRPGGPVDAFDRLRCRARAVERFGAARMVAEYERCYARAVAAHAAHATARAAERTPGPAPLHDPVQDDAWRTSVRIA